MIFFRITTNERTDAKFTVRIYTRRRCGGGEKILTIGTLMASVIDYDFHSVMFSLGTCNVAVKLLFPERDVNFAMYSTRVRLVCDDIGHAYSGCGYSTL